MVDAGVVTPGVLALPSLEILLPGVLPPGVELPTRRLRGRSSGSSPRCVGGIFLVGVFSVGVFLEVRWEVRCLDRLTSRLVGVVEGLVGVPCVDLGCEGCCLVNVCG